MPKVRTAFFCTACGHETGRWMGKCPACGEWDALAEAPSGAARDRGRVGEVRAVRHVEARLREATRLGFRRAVVPARGKGTSVAGIACLPARTIREALDAALA